MKEFDFELQNKAGIFFKFIQQILFLLVNVFHSSVIICQFSGYHSFLPVLFGKLTGKKVYIIAAGTDTVSFPSIGYGNFNKRFLKSFTSWSFQLASRILPKHQSLWLSDYRYASGNPLEQGIAAFVPNLNVPYTVIPNGYDAEKFYCIDKKVPRTFLTVTGALHYPFQKMLKGIDLILEVADLFPECTFTIIGVNDKKTIPNAPANVVLLPKVEHDELIHQYSKSQFYLQLSMAEGFPNALCEAMLCECVPIGSAVFSIPEIIGSTGFILKERNIDLLKEVIQKAINSDTENSGKSARKRIQEEYPVSKRIVGFQKIFNGDELLNA